MTPATTTERRVLDGPEALARYGAEWLCALAEASGRRFAVCLSGGSTPRGLYEWLAEPGLASRFAWERTHWFWGDERFVPHDHPASNYRMAREAFLSRVAVPAGNIHPVPTEGLSPPLAAAAYEAGLMDFYGASTVDPGRPLFDVTLLGIGEDGHTASLFPDAPALDERRRWAVDVRGPKGDPRVTLSYPVLDASRHVVFLATGAAKRAVLARVWAGERTLPAARIAPAGALHWFVDRDAAPEDAR